MVVMYDEITKLTFSYFIFRKISNEKTFKNITYDILFGEELWKLTKLILLIETNITLLKNKDFNTQLYSYTLIGFLI